jgi:uncharacterized protein DUF6600
MNTQRIAISLLLVAGLLAAGTARSQEPNPPEPPPYAGHDEEPVPGGESPVTEAATNDPAADSLDYFHEELAPYGQWVTHESYGEVWVPRVRAGWRPYTTGHWAYTDQGWAWMADEPWGWATFHYGRWFYDQGIGWAWVPGNTWAPAWVAWRSGDGYVGWAPLPPNIEFTAEGGLGLGVAAITAGFFTFVAERSMLAPNASEVIVSSSRNVEIVPRTANVTRYAVSDHRIIGSGVDVRRIEQATGRPVPRLRVGSMTSGSPRGQRGAFYQPAVVTRAERATRAEFGRALASQREAQRRSHTPGRAAESFSTPSARGSAEPRRSPGFTPRDHTTSQRSSSSSSFNRNRSYTPPPERQSQQSRPAPPTRARPGNQERAHQTQQRSQDRAQPQPRSQERPHQQQRSQERSQPSSSDKSRHKPPV